MKAWEKGSNWTRKVTWKDKNKEGKAEKNSKETNTRKKMNLFFLKKYTHSKKKKKKWIKEIQHAKLMKERNAERKGKERKEKKTKKKKKSKKVINGINIVKRNRKRK